MRHDARMPGFQGLYVDAAEGGRWELALSNLESGEGEVSADGVILGRNTSGPEPDGRLRVEVQCSTDPDFLTARVAETELRKGLAQVEAMAESDARFADLISRFGVEREYVWNYGMGKTLLASVRGDDSINWDWEPFAARIGAHPARHPISGSCPQLGSGTIRGWNQRSQSVRRIETRTGVGCP
jgi:hypothetical protein